MKKSSVQHDLKTHFSADWVNTSSILGPKNGIVYESGTVLKGHFDVVGARKRPKMDHPLIIGGSVVDEKACHFFLAQTL